VTGWDQTSSIRITKEVVRQSCSPATVIEVQDALVEVLRLPEGSRDSEISTGVAGNSVNNERLRVCRFCVNPIVPQRGPHSAKDWLLKLAETVHFVEEPARPTTSFAGGFESTMAGSGSGGPLSPESHVGPFSCFPWRGLQRTSHCGTQRDRAL